MVLRDGSPRRGHRLVDPFVAEPTLREVILISHRERRITLHRPMRPVRGRCASRSRGQLGFSLDEMLGGQVWRTIGLCFTDLKHRVPRASHSI